MTAGQIIGPPQSHGRMINTGDSEPGLTKPGTTARLTFDDYDAGLLSCDTEYSGKEVPSSRNNMLPSASLFYSEGKGNGFLQNTDAIITGEPPPPQKKLLLHCPGKQKRTPLYFVFIFDVLLNTGRQIKGICPFKIISCK